MISKLIAYSPSNRSEAIDSLKGALDRYVIRGIAHNTPFLVDVLRNEDFIAGNTPTNFIDVHYPDGFTGVQLNEQERAEMVAVAAVVRVWKYQYLGVPPLPLQDLSAEEEYVVCLGGMFGDASLVRLSGETIKVKHLSKSNPFKNLDNDDKESAINEVYLNSIDYDPTHPVVDITINGIPKAMQIGNESNTGLFNMQYCGGSFDCVVMTTREYQLSQFMKEPKILDTSNLVLSPMPGTLVSYAVNDGDEVDIGQEICVVEAMKMQNVLRSMRSGVIKKCHAELGSSLMTDETIVEFED
jgi:propionyl-CoA carboxylase alpha chain